VSSELGVLIETSARVRQLLLAEAEAALRRWSRLVAETWIVPAADDSETPIEPHAELRDFCEMEQALTFAASLPRATTRQLLSTEPDFAGGLPLLLRRVWLAMVLGRQQLTADSETIAAFREYFTEGALHTEINRTALGDLDQHLENAFTDPTSRQILRTAALKQLQTLDTASISAREFTLYLREGQIPDDEDAARNSVIDRSRRRRYLNCPPPP
jgi:hypothetical protein